MAAEIDELDENYGIAKTFDSYGRVSLLWYPNGFMVKNVYSNTGFLTEVRNGTTNALYWKANTTDAEGHVTQETYGNGVVTNRTYNAQTGLLTQASAGTSGSIVNQSFVYDSLGNLTQRYDAVTNLNESFGYDNLNRLTATTAVSGSNTTSVTASYNAIGNIISKSDVGTYSYGVMVNGVLTKPHAVTSITMMDGVTNYATYTYDANGNNLTGWGRTTTWTSWNMPASITKNGKTYGFVYNSVHERVKQTLPGSGNTTDTIYNISPRLDTGIHVEMRVKGSNGSKEYVHYLYAGSMPFGTVTTTGPGTITKTSYFHKDHLGSIIALTNETGVLTERRSYDAWGKRRNLNGTPITSLLTTPYERHGFTGHEELDEVGIIHMNGRMYDAATGRFLSADPTIQYPDDMQNYNRYSYINNNPLSAADPSGYGFFSVKKFFKSALKFITSPTLKNAFNLYGNLPGQKWADKIIMSSQLTRTIGLVAASYFGGPLGAAAHSTYYGYKTTGSVTEGVKAGAISAATSWAMGYVGGAYPGPIENVIAHGVVGCASSVASGGKCGPGAASGAFSAYAANAQIIKPSWGPLGGAMASAVIGGTASALGGGKFENGAMTGAFGYLFNYCAHTNCGEDVYNAHTDTLVTRVEREVLVPTGGYEWSWGSVKWKEPGLGIGELLGKVKAHWAIKALDPSINFGVQPAIRQYEYKVYYQVFQETYQKGVLIDSVRVGGIIDPHLSSKWSATPYDRTTITSPVLNGCVRDLCWNKK